MNPTELAQSDRFARRTARALCETAVHEAEDVVQEAFLKLVGQR